MMPVTYRIGGTQYVAVMAGYGGSELGVPLPSHSAAYRYGNAGRIIALKLDGGAPPLPARVRIPPLPQPPVREGRPDDIAAGGVLYSRFCARCHVLGRGVLPDLRRLTAAKHQLFYDIVLGGVLQPLGMGRFDDVLTRADAEAIHAYVVDEAWNGFRAQSHSAPKPGP
jgi:quinohemoprotein ethanol dehydrogenase